MIAGTPVEIPLSSETIIRGEIWAGDDRCTFVSHDIGADIDSVRSVAQRLAATGFSVAALDRPGHGTSDRDRNSAGLRADVKAALHALGWDTVNPYLVGVGQSVIPVLDAARSVGATAVALICPVDDILDTEPWSGPAPPAIMIFGAQDAAAGALAGRFARQHPAHVSLVRLPTDRRRTALLTGSCAAQVANHVTGFLRQVVRARMSEVSR